MGCHHRSNYWKVNKNTRAINDQGKDREVKMNTHHTLQMERYDRNSLGEEEALGVCEFCAFMHLLVVTVDDSASRAIC